MIGRRGFITGLVSFVAAPAIVRVANIMPVRLLEPSVELLAAETALIEDVFLVSFFKVLTQYPEMTASQIIQICNERGIVA